MRVPDKYVYPGTDVLINKFGCKDEKKLQRLEMLSTAGNLAHLQFYPLDGNFDFKHLKDIHRFIFQDIYDWAGEIRTVDIGKGNLFCRVQHIESYAKTVFDTFFPLCYKNRNDKNKFVVELANHYADMNALHPFREGNGRAQREFARELCLKCEYVLDLTKTKHLEMLNASILSFDTGDNSGFVSIFSKCVVPLTEYKEYQAKLTRSLLILSEDDM